MHFQSAGHFCLLELDVRGYARVRVTRAYPLSTYTAAGGICRVSSYESSPSLSQPSFHYQLVSLYYTGDVSKRLILVMLCRGMEPHLSQELAGGWWYPEDMQVSQVSTLNMHNNTLPS